MNKNASNKYRLIAFFIICILFIFTFIYNNIRNENNYDYSDLEIIFDNDDFIAIDNKLPVSDKIGKTFDGVGSEDGIQGYLVFSIKNSNDSDIKYDIYLNNDNNDKERNIKDDYIKLYLTNGNDVACAGFKNNVIPSYSDLPVLIDKPGSRLLYSSIISASSSEQFKLRVWLSDKYVISTNSEKFKFFVNVKTRY